jgi:hypothetical protein
LRLCHVPQEPRKGVTMPPASHLLKVMSHNCTVA